MPLEAGSVVARFKANIADMKRGISNVRDDVKGLNNTFRNAGVAIRGFGGLALAGVGAMTVGVGILGKNMVTLAGDAEEIRNKFEAVFGDMTEEADKFTERISKTVGRNVTDLENGLSAFQGFASGMGLAGEEAFDFSTKLQELSLDFASFNNLSDAEAQQRFIAAMSGSSEVLDMFGINIKQSALDLKLQEMGLAESTIKATEMEKAHARLAIIMESMGRQGAIGDAERTAGSYANSVKRLQAQIKTLKETIGKDLIPVINPLIHDMIEFIKTLDPVKIQNFAQSLANFIKIVAKLSIGLISFLSNNKEILIGVFVAMAVAIGVFVGSFIIAHAVIIGIMAAITAIVVLALKFWENKTKIFGVEITRIWQWLKEGIIVAVEGIIAFFTETIPKWIENMGKWFDKLSDKIWNALSNAYKNIVQWAVNTWEYLKVKIPEIINSVITWFKELPGNMIQIGKDIVQGLKNGILNSWDSFKKWMKGLIGDFIKGIKKGLGISSPSKVMAEIGNNITDGLVGGINENIKAIKDTANSLVSGITGENIGIKLTKTLALENTKGMGQTVVNINNPVISDEFDLDSLAQQLAFKLNNEN